MDQYYFNRLKELISNSYSPYSRLRVGAILISEDGREFMGVNVENSSYGLTICAERAAIFNAVSSGVKRFKKMYILGSLDRIIYPCGACLQVLSEFVKPSFEIVLFSNKGDKKIFRFSDLIKKPFKK